MTTNDRDLQAAWERGTPAEIRRVRPATSVLSIRVPSELLETLSQKAREEGKSASVFARDLIEAGLSSNQPSTPSELAKYFTRWAHEVEGSVNIVVTHAPQRLMETSWITSFFSSTGYLVSSPQFVLESHLHSLYVSGIAGKPKEEDVA